MEFSSLDPEKYGSGMPLDVSNMEHLWKGKGKTNGFLMRSVDGRIPALQLPIGRMYVGTTNVLSDDGVIPWGNALWRNNGTIDVSPGSLHAEKMEKGELVGVLKFNQGWQAGNPVQPWGLPSYSKGTVVGKGLVGYKAALASEAAISEYLDFLKGKADADDDGVRTTYKDWVASLKAGAVGSKLGLYFHNETGFPMVMVVSNPASPSVNYATFAGFAVIFEKEHEAVFFDIG